MPATPDTSIAAPEPRFLWKAALLTALAPMIWGTTYSVTTQVLPQGLPFTAAFFRTFPAGVILLLLVRRLPLPGEWKRLFILSALNITGFQAFLFIAAYRLPGGIAAVIGAVQPLMIMGLAWGVERQRPRHAAIWAAMIGVAGMAMLLLSPGSTTWDGVGIAAAFAGASSMAAGTYLTRYWKSHLPVLALTGWQLLLGGSMLIPFVWFADPPLPVLSGLQIAGYAYLMLFGALIAYGIWFWGISRLSPVAVSSLGLLSPLTAVVLGWLLLGQAMTGVSLLGLCMVLGSIVVIQNVMRRSSKPR